MHRRFRFGLIMMLVMALVLAACGSGSGSGSGSSGSGSGSGSSGSSGAGKTIDLKYAHPNAPDSVAGRQATLFAELVKEKTDGRITITVFPSGQLGNLQEITEGVQLGTIHMSHNTMAATGSLFADMAAFDTPYLYKDVDHMSRAMDTESPVMKMLNEKLVEQTGTRLLYTFYFGTRHLTADRPVRHPDDLKNVKIRSIPFDIYTATVEGMGAIATPIDWAEVPTALQTGMINGQENPLDVVLSNGLYELQDYLMLTGHIIASSGVIINEKTWQSFSEEDRQKILEAAKEARQQALEWNREVESSALDELKAKGMEIISEENGLDTQAFKDRISSLIQERFGEQFKYIYDEIQKMQ